MAVGGDIVEISYNHPTLGSGIFFGKANEDSTFDTGGIRTDDSADGIDGGGNAIYKKTRTRWGFECTISWDDNVKQEIQKLSNLAGSAVEAVFTVSWINGSVYKGSGTMVGDIKGSGMNATIPVKFAGGGILAKII